MRKVQRNVSLTSEHERLENQSISYRRPKSGFLFSRNTVTALGWVQAGQNAQCRPYFKQVDCFLKLVQKSPSLEERIWAHSAGSATRRASNAFRFPARLSTSFESRYVETNFLLFGTEMEKQTVSIVTEITERELGMRPRCLDFLTSTASIKKLSQF